MNQEDFNKQLQEEETLRNTWDDACERLFSALPWERAYETITVSLGTIGEMEEYIATNEKNLKPEELFFLRMSLHAKKQG